LSTFATGWCGLLLLLLTARWWLLLLLLTALVTSGNRVSEAFLLVVRVGRTVFVAAELLVRSLARGLAMMMQALATTMETVEGAVRDRSF